MGQEHTWTRRNFLGLGALAAAGAAAAGMVGCAPAAPSAQEAQGESVSNAGDAWLGAEPEIAESDIADVKETDLLIVGAGAAGMVAAATAADAKMDFMLCEQGTQIVETREYVGGVNTKYHKMNNVEVDEGRLLNELTRYASGKCKQDVINVWIRESAELIEWFDPIVSAAGKQGVLTLTDPNHETGGTSYYTPMLEHVWLAPYTPPMRNDILLSYIQDAGYDCNFGYKLVKLVHDGQEAPVTGAIFETEDGYVQVNAKNTLVCTGGYAGNPTMMRALQPEAVKCCTANSYAMQNKGDGLKAILWAGGVKDVEPAPMIFDRGAVAPGVDAGYADESDSATFPGPIFQTNIGSQPFMKVNREGKRFANESTPYDFICFAASKQPGGVWCQVFDSKVQEDVARFATVGCSAATNMFFGMGMPLEEQIKAELEAGIFQKADTLEELAGKLGFEGEAKQTFLATVENYNAMAEAGKDTEFGKEAYRLSTIKEGPFYGSWFGGSLLTTLDGADINAEMQVLGKSGKVIEGLYAAGDVSGNFFSGNYPEYIVGCASGRTMTEARHVVRKLAGEI